MNDIRSHLICEGFSPTYTNWIWHGELTQMSIAPDTESNDAQTTTRIEDMIRGFGQEGFREAHASYYDKLQTDSKMPLYLGCTTFTRLSAVLLPKYYLGYNFFLARKVNVWSDILKET